MNWLGIDVGGANLKVSDGQSQAFSQPFELWKYPDRLGEAIGELCSGLPASTGIAATMTGELADCYETKAAGVRHITAALQQGAAGRRLLIYCVDGQFRSPQEIDERPLLAAASNWHALARFATRFLPNQTGILVDIGTTTTDIIPLAKGGVATTSHNDVDRLLAGELVYCGVGRTPVCAVLDVLPLRGKECPVAAELFATTADAYCLLGDVAPSEREVSSADGRPMTEAYATDRLARQVCADRDMFDINDARAASQAIKRRQLELLAVSLDRVAAKLSSEPVDVLISGSGEFLAAQLVRDHPAVRSATSLTEQLGDGPSTAAAAHAVARLAAEMSGD